MGLRFGDRDLDRDLFEIRRAASRSMMHRRSLLGASVGIAAAALGAACGDSTGDRLDTPTRSSGPPVRVTSSNMVRTNWAKDRLALGSYSYLPVGATPSLRGLLAESVDGRIFWAGEATSATAPSTVHGALGSGRRAAREVADRFGSASRVIVIGAGVAGAAAAHDLHRLGHEVLVLEGRDRVGGRIATTQPRGWPGPVELGASWVHDARGHDLVTRLDDAGGRTARWDWDETSVIGESAEESDRRDAGFETAVEDAVAFAQDQDRDRSLRSALDESGAATDLDPDGLDTRLRREVTTEFGADADDLSASWTFEEGADGEDRLVLDGYVRVVDQLVAGLDVRLDATVTRVERDEQGVRVTAASGVTERADAVVVTVPLGVLKAGAVAFVPPLPAATIAAQQGLAMGLLDKVLVRFDEVVWDDALAWTLAGSGPEPFREWLNLEPLTGVPVLMALIGGRHAASWSPRSDDEVAAGAQASLRRLLSDL